LCSAALHPCASCNKFRAYNDLNRKIGHFTYRRTRIAGNAAGKWEKNVSSNIGFDATLFNGNTEIVFDLYKKDTKDLLYPVEQPATGGATPSVLPPFFNVGSMTNKGIDLSISQRGQFGGSKGIRFDATLTFTTYKNRITKITDGVSFFDSNSPANEENRVGGRFTRNAVGHPINSFYGYKIIGFHCQKTL